MTVRPDLVARFQTDVAPRALGAQLLEADDGGAVMRLKIAPSMRNGLGLAHGGFAYFAADTAFAYACMAADRPSVTHHAEVTYLAAVGEIEYIDAHATVTATYGRQTICTVDVIDSEGTLVASCRFHGVLTSRRSQSQQG